MSKDRRERIQDLAKLIASVNIDHPVRVGIDGVDCSGKTTLADELVEPLQSYGRVVIRASIDGFHNPAVVRRRQGATSPKGYYEDSFDLEALRNHLLLPLGPGGYRIIRTARFDFRTDRPKETPPVTAARHAIFIFDGVFLHRPELIPYWDFTVFVEASFDNTLKRAMARDEKLFGSAAETKQRYEERYIPGQRLYLQACNPADVADAVFVNNKFENPELFLRKTDSMMERLPRNES